jgi:UrcA family protein
MVAPIQIAMQAICTVADIDFLWLYRPTSHAETGAVRIANHRSYIMSTTARWHPPAIIIATLLAAGLGLGTISRAEGLAPQVRVKYSDLDLATPQGKRAFERRVEAAIHRVCPPPASLVASSPRSKQLVKACRRDTREQVRAQLQLRGIPATLLATRD